MVKNFNIVIVGLGGIGLRYLEGVLKLNILVNIYIYDISTESLVNAKKKWNENIGDKKNLKLISCNDIETLPKKIKILIISTTSKSRVDIIKRFVFDKKITINFWILEKVLTQTLDETSFLKKHFGDRNNIWVNMPRRLMSSHKELKKKFKNKKNFNFEFIGNNWGLACNSVHFIDLIFWWTGEKLTSINTDDLNKNWFESKRKGYFEINGKLQLVFSGGSKATFESNNIEKNFFIKAKSDRYWWKVDYNKQMLFSSDGNNLKFTENYQSELTPLIIMQIVKYKKCDLPPLKIALDQHYIFLKALLEYWNSVKNTNSDYLPIT